MDNSATVTQSIAPPSGRSVSIDQAAQLLGVSRRTIYNRIRSGRLRTRRTLGGSQRVLVDSLHAAGFRHQAFPAPDAGAAMPGGSRARF